MTGRAEDLKKRTVLRYARRYDRVRRLMKETVSCRRLQGQDQLASPFSRRDLLSDRLQEQDRDEEGEEQDWERGVEA